MKVYYYTDAEVGVPWPGPDADREEYCQKVGIPWPRFVWCAFPSFEKTDKPEEADIFVIRQRLFWLEVEQVRNLPYLEGNEERHVFFDFAPESPRGNRAWPGISAIFIRGACSKNMLENNPTTISWPGPVDDLKKYVPAPSGGFKYDIVFQGHVYNIMPMVATSVRGVGVSFHYVPIDWWGMDLQEKAPWRKSFLHSLHESRLSLCVTSAHEGIVPRFGVIRYRFFEAMSMGRVPVHICDECVYPLNDRIDYSRCSIKIKEEDISCTGEILATWLAEHSDDEIIEMGLYGRKMWERWLKRENWCTIVDELVRERLEGPR